MRARPAVAMGVVIILAAVASASTIRVDWSGQGDYLTIQEGINAASSGDTVLVAPGTYTGSGNRDIRFGGRHVVLASESGRDFTTIDCQHSGRAFIFDCGERQSTVVQGFTITNGTADHGGALWCPAASPWILECSFVGNSAEFGGAIYFAGVDSLQYVDYCTFSDNHAADYGGAIYTYSARPYVYECEFTGNSAGINGGAISCKTGTVASIYNSFFTSNTASDGGAIYVGTFFGSGDEGLEHSNIGFNWFSDNSASRGGAIFLNSYSWVRTTWCTFVSNSADQGGGLYARTDAEGSLTVQNCTLVYNSAGSGGGICSAGSSTDNQLTVTQTVIAFSTLGSSVCRLDYSPIQTDYSLAYGNEGGDVMHGGTTNLFVDPLFCDIFDGDYNLCENSPCRGCNNDWGFLMGSHRQTCGPCTSPVREVSWGSIKAMYR